jgi:hypothetical protein
MDLWRRYIPGGDLVGVSRENTTAMEDPKMKQLLMLIAILALLPFSACTLTMSGCTYGVVSAVKQ